jgi:hypothetical protein
MRAIGITATVLLMAVHSIAARLTPSADQEFARYIADVEGRLARQHTSSETYLATTRSRQLSSGSVQIEPVNGGIRSLSGALLHHWRGAAFIPNSTPKDMLVLLRSYNSFPRIYAPEVVSSRALKDDGDTATLAMRLKEQRLVTVVLDAEYQVESHLIGDRGYSLSRSTHIWQVDDPGSSRERRHKEGDDDGYLWRLNSYWSFAQAADGSGLSIECEAVSLTRDVPLGLGRLLNPLVQTLPREMLEFTLKATRNALKETHR